MKINGIDSQKWIGSTIACYLRESDIPLDRVVVEVNGEIVQRQNFDVFVLKLNQWIEVVEFVGGG